MAAQAAVLLRFDYPLVFANTVCSLFILFIAYNLMFAIYTRYDQEITKLHILLSLIHILLFTIVIILSEHYFQAGYFRSTLVLVNAFVPYALAIKKCNQQFKTHRIGDKVLYGSLLIIMVIFTSYVASYILFYFNEKQAPLILYFISLLSFVCILFFGFALSIIYSLVGKLRKEIITDRLTGAKNRNYLNEVSSKLISLAKRTNMPVSIILCDIDLFKNINDSYGHSAGDKVLIKFSNAIEETLREEDIFIRIGGEEFIILLPHVDLSQAKATAERIRALISKMTIEITLEKITISASFGVTQINLDKSLDENINDADIALYEAKRGGRNKVICFNE